MDPGAQELEAPFKANCSTIVRIVCALLLQYKTDKSYFISAKLKRLVRLMSDDCRKCELVLNFRHFRHDTHTNVFNSDHFLTTTHVCCAYFC